MAKAMIRRATESDYERLALYAHHIRDDILRRNLAEGTMLLAEADDALIGWLRWNLFWDSIPFMNHLFILEERRGQGHGAVLVASWEALARKAGYDRVMTSSAQDETAQHFYVRLGYRAVGGFTLTGDPLEILFEKPL